MWPGVAVRAPSLPLVVRGRPGEGVALSVLDRGRFPRTGHRDGRGIAVLCRRVVYNARGVPVRASHLVPRACVLLLYFEDKVPLPITRLRTGRTGRGVRFYGCTIAVSVSVLCRGITAITYL